MFVCLLNGFALTFYMTNARSANLVDAYFRPVVYTIILLKNHTSDDGWFIHPCHTAAILSRETKRALFYHAKSLAMETMGMRLSVVKQSFFCPPGQYGRRVTRVNSESCTRKLIPIMELHSFYPSVSK